MKDDEKINESALSGFSNVAYYDDRRYKQSPTAIDVPPFNQQQKGQDTPYSTTSRVTYISPCDTLYGWQQSLINELHTRKDIYIIAQPGTGKTAPVVCYWINNILGINTSPTSNQSVNTQADRKLKKLLTAPESFEKVMWLAPIQNLNSNMNLNFTEDFVEIIVQFLNRIVGEPDSKGNLQKPSSIRNYIIDMIKIAGDDNVGSGKILLDMLMPTATNPNVLISAEYVNEFRKYLGNIIRNYVDNCLVGIQQEGTSNPRMSLKIKGKVHYKPFVACIYESAKNIIDKMNNLSLIVCDEAQRLQGDSTGEDKARAQQIASSMHEVLTNKNSRSAQMIMLSGTTNPASAKNLTHFLNATYDRKFNLNVGPVVAPDKNPSDIIVLPMDGLNNRQKQIEIIRRSLAGGHLTKTGIVYIIFGKDRINSLIDELAPEEYGFVGSKRGLAPSGTTSLFGKFNAKEISSPGDINDISDPRLRRAVSNRIGFLYRPKEELTPANQRDSAIVQSLFRDGKINVLLCTDAIREGINILAKTMYLPTIEKPPDYKPMDSGSLSQLINRTGRTLNMSATIYTDQKFVPNVLKAISGSLTDFSEQPSEYPKWNIKSNNGGFKDQINKYKSMTNTVSSAIRYWTGIIKGRG